VQTVQCTIGAVQTVQCEGLHCTASAVRRSALHYQFSAVVHTDSAVRTDSAHLYQKRNALMKLSKKDFDDWLRAILY
jgi:hypothetical protein